MKNILSILAVAATGFVAQAQWVPPASVPQGVYTDINGVDHDIQGYLDEGKTVVVDVSATWCGPCWSFHESKYLDQMHNMQAEGDYASGDVVVLWIEGDANTGMTDLNGGGSSQGDWVTGTDFPIIDDATLAGEFNISYYPTIFTICPDGTMTEMVRNNGYAAFAEGTTTCGASLPDNEIGVANVFSTVCDGTFTLGFDLENLGETETINGTYNITQGGSNVFTQAVSGLSMTSLATETVVIDLTGSSVDENSSFDFEFVNDNNEPVMENNAQENIAVAIATEVTPRNFYVSIQTDNYPNETIVAFFDNEGTLVWRTPAMQGPTQTAPSPDAGQFFYHGFDLGADQCYTVGIFDTYGDGIGEVAGLDETPFVRVEDGNGNVLLEAPTGNFTTVQEFNKGEGFVLSTEELDINQLAVYPNPATNEITVSGVDVDAAFSITTVAGQNVLRGVVGTSIDISDLSTGLYIMEVNGVSSKFIVK